MINCLEITRDKINKVNISHNQIKMLIEDYNMRDLYFIDKSYDISSLTKKKNCIICKLDYLEAIIFTDTCYLINNQFITLQKECDINNFIRENSCSSFHIIVLEYLFINCIEIINKEFHYLITDNALNINYNLYTNLLNLEYRIIELLDIIKDLNDSDNFKQQLNILGDNDDDNDYYVEQFLENSELKLEDIQNDVSKFIRNIDNNQKIDNIRLAKDRNKYALYNLYISFLSISISLSTLITSILGMNVKNNIETSIIAFYLVNGLIIIAIPCIFLIQILIFNKFSNKILT